ncbi:MAG TPA: response regulator [Candidatus Acidoferrales bacterium]|jgi:CheY-like chemotaxis protein|nr:response regulator [Candidatus Acidoferrales bacterium]
MNTLESICVEASPNAPLRHQPASPRRILVVDDDSDTRQLSVDLLVDSGYDVEAAKDGAAGWKALQAKNYDLVITDNKMPLMTGIEMIEKLRDAYMPLPVIMATQFPPVDEFHRKPWLIPDATLERPFTNDELLGLVKRILGTDDGRDDVKESPVAKYL